MTEKSLLIADDDEALLSSLGRAMGRRGYNVHLAHSLSEAQTILTGVTITHAIVDLRLGEDNGLDVVEAIKNHNENARVIVLSGYGNIPTAVAAVKVGAIDYLPKPSDADDLDKALSAPPSAHAEPPVNAMTPDAIRWAHIRKVYIDNDQNISQTARSLGMHRRTLQRMLSKRSADIENQDLDRAGAN
ncbi:MAG: response regulator [Pseudomonadota bacterium]